jgi:glucose/arabinose dehydrogenase
MRPSSAAARSAALILFIACAPKTDAPGDSTDSIVTATDSGGVVGRSADCTPVETRATTASGQTPASTGQTRTCSMTSDAAFDVTVVARGLVKPWSVEPLAGGDLMVSEKGGNIRIVSADGKIGAPITGVTKVDARGQGGLLDLALSPSFDTDRTIYWSFTEPRQGGNGTSVARGVLSADRTRLEQVSVIFRALPTYENNMHYGSRVLFSPDGKLYVTTGERSDAPMRKHSQQLDGHLGKTLRINPDGTAPSENPFVGQAGAKPEIWSLGHRNIQAAAFDDGGQLWVIEHGANGGDELNRVEKGKNYGWPLQAYGIEYAGGPIPGAVTNRPEFEQPVYYWDPVIAPSGAQFYSGDAFPAWRGSLFVGALKEMRLVRLKIERGRVTGEEHLLVDRRQRVRDVRQGPDGALYLVTDAENGELWKIAPRR